MPRAESRSTIKFLSTHAQMRIHSLAESPLLYSRADLFGCFSFHFVFVFYFLFFCSLRVCCVVSLWCLYTYISEGQERERERFLLGHRSETCTYLYTTAKSKSKAISRARRRLLLHICGLCVCVSVSYRSTRELAVFSFFAGRLSYTDLHARFILVSPIFLFIFNFKSLFAKVYNCDKRYIG